ncbi:YggT family protein [Pontiellaceae bacterium B12219]|nr:YggT family protein [Pontiellaceae bacterium B12219]
MFLFRLLNFGLGLYELGLFIYILCSWIVHPVSVNIRRGLARAYEPVLTPIRRWVPAPRFGGVAFDLSPIILLIVLGLLRRILFALFF